MHIPGYQIEREIGQGGMAIVYLATQESLHRPVALKVIKPVLSTDEEFAHRFLREGRIIAQLSDPHIVTVYDIAAHDHTYYLSMEYLPGGTLQQRIRDGLPLEEVLPIARAIASALYYAHRRNIIHRDIKPQNILFRENGAPVLTDFGIAKTLGTSTVMTRTGLSLGTPRYMSPEQIRGQVVDARADLYSFGVLLYEMLIGHVPFNAEDSFALAMMHVTSPIPELPPKLQTFQPLLNKLLDKDPNLRFQTGQDFIIALDALDPTAHSPLTITDPTRKVLPVPPPPSRRWGWKAGALAAGLAGVALGGGYWFLSQPPSPPTVSTSTPPSEPPTVDLTAQRQAEAEQLLGQARQQQQAGALNDSLARIEQGLRLMPDHAGLLALKQEVSTQIAAADTHKTQEEEQARQQMQADQFLDQARIARQEGKLDLSLVHIEQGLQALPNHASLLALKQEVLATQQAETKRQETAERQKAEAEKQKAEAEKQKAEAEQRRRKADEWLARALDSQRNRAYETSLNQIEQGLQQASDHARLLTLRDEVRRQLREAKAAPPPPVETKPSPDNSAKIATLLRNCDAHLRANRLTSGKGGNATDCYGEVLKLDQGNADALAGLDRIADRYAESAASAIQRGDAKAARGYLDRVARLNPGYPRLASLREQLTQAESATKSTPPPEPAPPKKTDLEPIDLVSTPQRTEPATPSTPARTGPAQLMVRSNVEDAEISINGRAIGTVPMQIEMKAGVYRVRVSQEGYIDWNGKVELTAGQEQTVQAVLKKKSEKSEPVADAAPPATPRKTPAPEAPPEPESADRNAEKRAAAPEPTPPARTPAPSETPTAKPGQAPNCLKGDCNNGSGTYRYPDGSEYSGDFRNAKMHGQGTYVYAGRGEKYVGDWRNGVINGQGTYYYRSGNRYEGDWRNGRKNGQGTYYYTDRGDKYVGDFKNDQPNGQGVYYYSNGDRYEGEWSNGRKNGQGVMYQNGMKIVGEWRNDQKVQVSVEQ